MKKRYDLNQLNLCLTMICSVGFAELLFLMWVAIRFFMK